MYKCMYHFHTIFQAQFLLLHLHSPVILDRGVLNLHFLWSSYRRALAALAAPAAF